MNFGRPSTSPVLLSFKVGPTVFASFPYPENDASAKETHHLADDPQHAAANANLITHLDAWIEETKDTGLRRVSRWRSQATQAHILKEKYILEWQDEFTGDTLDTSKWAYREDNQHQSIQRRENVSIVDGALRLDLRVMEAPIERKTASGAGIVWDDTGKKWGRLPNPPNDRTLIPDFDAGEWHTYAFEWTPAQIRFYVDGQVTQIAEYPSDEHVHDEVNVWLTAISANWNHQGDQIPSKAEYDYLRFYRE